MMETAPSQTQFGPFGEKVEKVELIDAMKQTATAIQNGSLDVPETAPSEKEVIIRRMREAAEAIEKHPDEVIKFEEMVVEGGIDTGLRERDIGLLEQYRRITHAEELREQAEKDPLTGLLNRREMERRFGRFIRGMVRTAIAGGDRRREGGWTPRFWVIMLDADNFKKINDTYGHNIGDMALQHVAASMKERLRKSDLLSRWGGEEFLVVAPQHVSGEDDVDKKSRFGKIAEELRSGIGKEAYAMDQNDKKLMLTMSAGAVLVEREELLDMLREIGELEGEIKEEDVTDEMINKLMEKLIKTADERLYQAKETGRNRLVTTDALDDGTKSVG